MTPQEFKAWFDGFTEAVEETPSRKQWTRIKERVAEIDGKPVTERVYVGHYPPSSAYCNPYWQGPVWTSCGTTRAPNTTMGVAFSSPTSTAVFSGGGARLSQTFDSLAAMNALGTADAASLS